MLTALSRVRHVLFRRSTRQSINQQTDERTRFVRQFDGAVAWPLRGRSRLRDLTVVCLASAVGLYLEMVMVRWHSSCMHTFGVFKNVSMLSCFLGLGIGYALSGTARPIRLRRVLPLLALQCLVFALISRTRLGRLSLNPIAEHYIMWQSDWRWWVEGLGGNAVLAITFLINSLMFIPLGQVAGVRMRNLLQLAGYACNLAGSAAGIGLFVILSALWAPPIIWMGLAAAGIIMLTLVTPDSFSAEPAGGSIGDRDVRSCLERPFATQFVGTAIALVVMMFAFGLIDRAGVQHYYSPYQTITCQLGPDSKYPCVARLMVNQASFQRVINLSPDAQSRDSALQRIAEYYDLPHRFKPDAERVLVVGAGTGNDVAAALRADPSSVTAVEIDPTILFLGNRLHPERPYADPRVHAVNDDARTYIRNTNESFDLIVYGLLDSHTMLGSMTNVRLDSFVYTAEALREAASRLSDDGLLAVTFAVMTPQQGRKLYLMLQQAFDGQTPRCFEVGYDGGVMMVAGPATRRMPETLRDLKEITSRFSDPRLIAEASTDDWPFFYMPRRTYPLTYAVMITLLLTISGLVIYRTVGLPKELGTLFGPFFFLGAGFMLIETKAVTQLGLVLGNNWQVLAVVVTAILLLAFLANVWVMWRGPMVREKLFGLLLVSLLIGTAMQSAVSSGWRVPMAGLTLTVALTLPLLFSGLIFSSELARGGELAQALSSNLFGAMLGGFLEYNAMYWGYSSLTWIGLAIYAVAYLAGTQLPSGGFLQPRFGLFLKPRPSV